MTDPMRSLTPTEVARLLEATVGVLGAEIAALPDTVLRWHPAPDEWCVKDVLGHLIEAERRGFAGRIRIILASDGPKLEGWDPAAVTRARRDCEKEARTLLDELRGLRAASVTLVAKLGVADLARGGHHPVVGDLRVGDLLHEWVHHDRNHVKQVLANVQAFAWPAMGNAQKFSAATAPPGDEP
jgi:hypothetical protein